jgi:predicted dehydrogenase
MLFTPIFLGRGRAGAAVAKALQQLPVLDSRIEITPPIWLERGQSLAHARSTHPNPILCITNPHALHAPAIVEAERAGYLGVLCEKPAAVTLEQIEQLRAVKMPVAIFHGYRMMWGIQTLKNIVAGKTETHFGELTGVEGRYWQSSAGERAWFPAAKPGWKDDPTLSGPFDVTVDLATHWVDAVNFIIGKNPTQARVQRSYANAESPHRDTHVHVELQYSGDGHAAPVRALGSISKTTHGYNNFFELVVMGTHATLRWEFLRPDEIWVGKGHDSRVISRRSTDLGSQQSAFHGQGWLEGYLEISRRFLLERAGLTIHPDSTSEQNYPSLQNTLPSLEMLIRTGS